MVFSQLTALKEIGERAFSGCALAGDIVFASGIQQLGRDAFYNNDAITSIDFSKSTQLTVISEGTFRYCQNLKKVDFQQLCLLEYAEYRSF